MENKIVLVTGGARSGKSAFSERLVRENSSRHVYIATCPVLDDEMRGRVKLHRERRRGYQWITIEEQLDLAGALKRAQEENADGVLIDCLTLWINNLMYHLPKFDEEEMKKKTADLLGALEEYPGQVVLVLNEVGLGIVPGTPEGRVFRDCSGALRADVRGGGGRSLDVRMRNPSENQGVKNVFAGRNCRENRKTGYGQPRTCERTYSQSDHAAVGAGASAGPCRGSCRNDAGHDASRREKNIVLMAGDHGIVKQGVCPNPQSVTTQMIYNFVNRGAGINVLAENAGAKVTVVGYGGGFRSVAAGAIRRGSRP